MQILYKLQIVNNKFTLSLYTESMKTLLFMFIITFLIKPLQLSTVYLVLFLYFLAKKDYETMYIEKYWITFKKFQTHKEIFKIDNIFKLY